VIRVVLAEDHHLVRTGIRAILESVEDIQIVGEAEDGLEAIEIVARQHPDVLVLDIAMPRLNGIQTAERVRALYSGTNMLILSMYSEKSLVHQAFRSGVKGYLVKRSVKEELLLAVRAASRGKYYLSPEISTAILDDFLARKVDALPSTPVDQLTPREHQVLQLITEGHTNISVAQNLKISVKTVEKHRANLIGKLGVQNIAGLVRVAIKHGLIFLDE